MEKVNRKIKVGLFCLSMLFFFAQASDAQDTNHVTGWTYHRYGEEIGLLGNRFIAFIPDSYDANKTYRIIVWQHGAGGNAEDIGTSILEQLKTRGINDDVIVISPHMTTGEWRYNGPEIPSTQEYLNHLKKIRRDYNTYEKVFLHGFSMGGQFGVTFGMFYADELAANVVGGYGNGVILPSGNYYCSVDENPDPVRTIDDLCVTGKVPSMVETYFNSVMQPLHSQALEIPWFAYLGENETASRLAGHYLFTDSMQVGASDFTSQLISGIGHSINDTIRDKVIDFFNDKMNNSNVPPVADANITQSSGLTVQFDATGSADSDGSIDRYQWEFGDETSADQASVSHTYASEGTYMVRLRVTDNDNDMKTLYQSVTVTASSITVNTPSETYAVHVNTPYDTEYEFTTTDFTTAVTDADGDALKKIRINSAPLKGELELNGTLVTVGQEILVEEIPFLVYKPIGNKGEDYMEYNAYDGYSWSPFEDSRINVMIGQPSPEIFTNINPTSGNPHAVGSLEDGTYYYTDQDAVIAQGSADYTVPDYLNGAEIIRTNGTDDKDLTGASTLSFDVLQDATLYIAFEGGKTTPDWMDPWSFHSSDDVYSWFYFDLYKKDFTAGSTVTLGGNLASPSDAARMYFVIGLPNLSNIPPVLSDTVLETAKNTTLDFSSTVFESLFLDQEADGLTTVKITRLPLSGTLQLNSSDVVLDQEISAADLNQLQYIPQTDYSGFDNFKWNASDGSSYAAQDRKVHLNVKSGTASTASVSASQPALFLFPNPVQDRLFVRGIPQDEDAVLQIFTVHGSLVFTQTLTNHMSIDMSDWERGVYFVAVQGHVHKVIKE